MRTAYTREIGQSSQAQGPRVVQTRSNQGCNADTTYLAPAWADDWVANVICDSPARREASITVMTD